MRSRLLSLGLVAAFLALVPRDARACGGSFESEPVPGKSETPVVVTDHRIAIAISPTMTTLWDQVEYVGDPQDFAWVMPVKGSVVVGVGTDEFLDGLDQKTHPQIEAPLRKCSRPARNGCEGNGTAGCGNGSDPGDDYPIGYQEDSGVFVTGRSVVGPYATVQIHGTDEGSIAGWLRAHKYVVPTEVEPILKAYVDEGFDFVAVRLRPNAGVRAMRPIRVSFHGTTPQLPLRMVAAGAGARVGVELFVIGEGRWRTKNFPTLAIDPASLTWDFGTEKSDYVPLRDAMSAKFADRAFTMESSIAVDRFAVPDVGSTPPAEDAATTDAESDAATDAPTDAPTYDAGPAPGVDPTANDVEIAFGTFSRMRVTRLRANLPQKALDTDLELELDDSQSEVLASIQVTKSTGTPVCPMSETVAGEGVATPLRAASMLGLAALGAILARRASRRAT
ncbi:MAG: DUF2330 domain-containing protein [Polyangiales bacterium]